MTIAHESHRQRVEAGVGFEWDLVPERKFAVKDLSPDASALSFHRKRYSHRGIGELRHVTTLRAHSVDQSFLEEITTISSLRVLYMETVRATDLTSLRRLSRLERLVVKDATCVADLDWAVPLSTVRSLAVENFKLVSSLQPLSELQQLEALGVEGSCGPPCGSRRWRLSPT